MQRLLQDFRPALMSLVIGLLVAGSAVATARQEKTGPRAWLGVAVQDVSESVAAKNNLTDGNGAYVSQVTEDSPADSAGIRKGDIIVELNKKQLEDADGLVKGIGKLKAGDRADLVVVRKGEKKTFQVALGKAPRTRQFAVTIRRPEGLAWMLGNHTTQGMQLMEMNEQLSEYFGVSGGSGVLVEKVEKGSAAEKAGLKAGDVLQKIGKRTIDDLEDVTKALRRAGEGDKIAVEVLRKGQTKSMTLEVEEDDMSSQFRFFRGDAPEAGFQRIPRLEENFFKVPDFKEQEFRMQWDNVNPKMDELKERMRDMMQDLKEHRGDMVKAVRMLKVRTV